MIRAVLFDAAGTLLHIHPSVGDVYASEAALMGVNVSAHALNDAFKSAWGSLRPPDGASPFHTSESVEREWWRNLVRQVFGEAGVLDQFGEQFELFFDALYERFEQPGCWRLYDDVIPALDALDARRVPFSIVSNWDSRLPRLLRAMGIAERFRFILTSAEVGVSKPDAEIFAQAVRRLGFPASDVLHVGDSVEEDLMAAQRAGLKGVLVSRRETIPAKHGAIGNLLQIINVLEASIATP
ncbi:MAG: HAD-IA family hydrolase [Candidatus Hydrogenedentes bacterium]|nr:HAD-IA family hydrolase [Candidatus Hydrogenedentota bacterium]